MEGVYSSSRWVDEEFFAAADTVSVEGFGHVNVNDVDPGGLGIRRQPYRWRNSSGLWRR